MNSLQRFKEKTNSRQLKNILEYASVFRSRKLYREPLTQYTHKIGRSLLIVKDVDRFDFSLSRMKLQECIKFVYDKTKVQTYRNRLEDEYLNKNNYEYNGKIFIPIKYFLLYIISLTEDLRVFREKLALAVKELKDFNYDNFESIDEYIDYVSSEMKVSLTEVKLFIFKHVLPLYKWRV